MWSGTARADPYAAPKSTQVSGIPWPREKLHLPQQAGHVVPDYKAYLRLVTYFRFFIVGPDLKIVTKRP